MKQSQPHPDDEIDWKSFRFPPPPPRRWNEQTPATSAPSWAAPPSAVRSWYLDGTRLLIIHPLQRKKIDLARVNTRRRLAALCMLIGQEQSNDDVACLWRAIDQACWHSFSTGLSMWLINGATAWSWKKDERDSQGDHDDDDDQGEHDEDGGGHDTATLTPTPPELSEPESDAQPRASATP